MTNATTPISLAVGDRVVYPNQGLCRVDGIEEKEVAGQRLSFVSLRREEDGARVLVPQAKVAAIGVRKVAGPDEVQKIFDFLRSDSDKASLDWKARARTNVERMSTGGLQGLAEVVKALQVLSELRPLPTKERELYDDARHLLVTEVSAALAVPACDAEDAVDAVLFVPGRERPRRTAEEFRATAGDDELGMGDDLLGLEGEDALGGEDAAGEPEEAAEGEGEGEEAEAEEKPKAKKGAKGKEKPKEKAEPPPKRPVLSDFEVTEPIAEALRPDLPLPKKRGRPPKAKPAAPEVRVEAPHARPLEPKMAPIEPEKPQPKHAAAAPPAAPAHAPAHAPAPAAAHGKAAKAKEKPAPKAAAKKAAKPAAKPKDKKAPAKGKKK